jgi:hypothetical protein
MGAEAADAMIAPPAGRTTTLPLGWGDSQAIDLPLPPHRPMREAEAEALKSPSKPERAAPSTVTHLPPVVLNSPDGSLQTIDLVPTWDALVSQAPRPNRAPASDCAWPKPVELLERLEVLASECETGPWAMEVAGQIDKLGLAAAEGSDDPLLSIIGRLEEAARAAERRAAELDDPFLATEFRRTRHALARRLTVWTEVIATGGPRASIRDDDTLDPKRLSQCLAQVNEIPADPDVLDTWREYLDLEALERAIRQPAEAEPDQLRKIARHTLSWMTAPGLSAEQQAFLEDEPLVSFKEELQRWAFESADLGDVLRHLEAFERTGSPSDARHVAEDCLLLGLSSEPDRQQLAERLRTHYRNANLRIVLTRELLERMMPEREPEVRAVRDHVMGASVRGRSVASADLSVLLLPDPNRLRLALVVEGLVSSPTESTAGPATFYSVSRSKYVAVREIELGASGLERHPVEVAVDSDVRLRGLRTSLDSVPLLGSMAQGMAHSQHAQMRSQMNRQVKQKVASRAKQQVERETEVRLREMDQKLETRVLEPLRVLCLGPTVVSSQTTERRLTARLRLASEHQLGSNSPRPRAPADSLASCQIHESALNNAIERLLLDGGTFTLAEVRQRIATVFNSPEMLEENPGREDVRITFAPRDSVRARFQEGRVVLTLSIARLKKSPRLWKDFQVCAYYRPELNDREAVLVRDGIVELRGAQALRSQIALRGVFSGVFSKNRPWTITPDGFLADPRLSDLSVTQLVIDDGWIGLALGPTRGDAGPVVARRDSASAE